MRSGKLIITGASLLAFLVNSEMLQAGPADALLHNQVRQAVNNGTVLHGYDYAVQKRPASTIQDMVFDMALQTSSLAVAKTCDFNHSGTPNGENLFAGTGSATIETAVKSWASEVVNYDNDSGCATGQVCGHYTQVVWANTLRVGCSARLCSPLRDNGTPVFGGTPATFIVCQYSPPGNIVGQKPYITGVDAIPRSDPYTFMPPILLLLDEQ